MANSIPDFDFSGFYYAEILQALVNYKRKNLQELTDESDFEPSMQFLKAFALVGHLSNVTIDIVANESFFKSAKLAESVRDALRLIGYEMKSSTPSTAPILYKLSKVFNTSFALIPEASRAATVATDGGDPVIYFETNEGLTITRTDQFNKVFHGEYVSPGVYTFTDITASIVGGIPNTFAFTPKDIICFGHPEVQWDAIDITMGNSSPILLGVWEFYDGKLDDIAPDSVVDVGNGRLQLEVNSLLGDAKRAGALVTVRLLNGLATETVESFWDGDNKVEIGFLGQSTPSLTASDYLVGVLWKEIDGLLDETQQLDLSGQISYPLPQNEKHSWSKTTLNGVEAYYIRYRLIDLTSGVSMSMEMTQARMDLGDQFVLLEATQGRSVIAETLGSSNGDESQTFRTQQTNFIFGSEEVRVDGVAWTRVDNFLDSESASEHYRVELIEGDRARIAFGDGSNGKIPPVGVGNIVIDYRFGANDNGNVGSNTITVDKQSLSFIETITNPRPATGWAPSQASDAASLERVKEEGPASLRTREVALSPDDAVDLAVAFRTSNGAKPFVRARAFEESYGPKTVELVLVAHGGGAATSGQLEEISDYFNGNPNANPPIKKHFIVNHQVIATNYAPLVVDLDITIYGPSDIDTSAIVSAMQAFLDPEAVEADLVTWKWNFGDEIDRGRIGHECFVADSRAKKIQVNTPASNLFLGNRQLPKCGSVYVTIIST